MVTTTITSTPVLSLLPGRARVHLPAWSRKNPREVESLLCRVDGLRAAQANPLTGNVLVHFDPHNRTADRVLSELSALHAAWSLEVGTAVASLRSKGAAGASTAGPASGKSVVARAVVGGTLGHAAVDTLFYSATAAASALGWPWVGSLVAAHLVLDVFVWGVVLHPVVQHFRRTSLARPLAVTCVGSVPR